MLKHLEKSIHPAIFSRAYPTQGRREAGVYPRRFRAQGRGLSGQGVSLSQRTTTHTHSHIMDNIEMSISLKHMSLDWGRKLSPKVHGGNFLSSGRTCKLRAEDRIKPPTLEVWGK